MTGIGEGVINIEGLAQTPAVLVNPRVPTPTGAVFQAFDSLDGRNDLEPPAIAAVPLINDVLRVLSVQSGSQIARMSGSGASCFTLFERQAQAELAAKTIAKSHPNWWVTPCRFGEPD